MSITTHPGFEASLGDEGLTATQAVALTEWMRLGEIILAVAAQSEPAADPVPDTSSQEQLKCQTPPDRNERLCACGYPQPQQSHQKNSSNVSHFDMTASENMARSKSRVES